MMLKLLERSTMAPIDPASERQLFELLGRGDELVPSPLPGDVAPRLRRPATLKTDPLRQFDATTAAIDAKGESDAEEAFIEWLNGQGGIARHVIPQASFDLLLRAHGIDASACRRCDFLVTDSDGRPLVIEVDGQQHQDQTLTDDDRDRHLRSVGIETFRIPAAEARSGSGPTLTEVASRLRVEDPQGLDPLYWAPIQVHRLVVALLEGLRAGFLAGDRWVVSVRDPIGVTAELLGPYLELFDALDRLWGARGLAPKSLTLESDGSWFEYTRQEDGSYVRQARSSTPVDVVVHLDCDRSAAEALPNPTDSPCIVTRSCVLPVEVTTQHVGGAERVTVSTDTDDTRRALRTVLRSVFAKDDFRPGQFEALAEVLEGRDCTVLLPTGAGKSLIYQLAGLCLPGRTLVIDPIVALIEDQIEGLRANGIDRAVGITRETSARGQTDTLLAAVADADAFFVLVAPERLQMAKFRNALAELAQVAPINLAVIDEAHCVSEWGHDFRTSYLTLGDVIRRECVDPRGAAPPLLALTGTASRAVLRDVLYQLSIEQRTENSIVRPATFDRPELDYRVVRTTPDKSEGVLRATLKGLPDTFGQTIQTFFEPNGELTYSGLVFVPTVNGGHGVPKTLDVVRTVVPSARPYAGKPPKGWSDRTWERDKRVNATDFKENNAVALVTTKAFGMGIDKANIRWVVHYGLPGSIEAYYQEVGRAGRDRGHAECALLLTEFSTERNRSLLAEDLGLEQARLVHGQVGRKASDDVTTALFFHVNSFPGVEAEVESLVELVGLLEPGSDERRVEIPFGGLGEGRERALHRLVILGVIRDYLVEFGARKYDVTLASVDTDSVVGSLLGFVERTQPGRLDPIRASVVSPYAKVADAIETCGRALIEFVYETIERSRRRALREMWLAAIESHTSEDLRQRVLAYLSDGDITPAIERLVELSPFSFSPWIDLWSGITTATDAREWRGASARLLSSFPSHPGLLFSRGLAEALDVGGDLRELESNVESALRSATSRYGSTNGDIDQVLRWALHQCRSADESIATESQEALVGGAVLAGCRTPVTDAMIRDHAITSRRLAGFLLADGLADALNLASQASYHYS